MGGPRVLDQRRFDLDPFCGQPGQVALEDDVGGRLDLVDVGEAGIEASRQELGEIQNPSSDWTGRSKLSTLPRNSVPMSRRSKPSSSMARRPLHAPPSIAHSSGIRNGVARACASPDL